MQQTIREGVGGHCECWESDLAAQPQQTACEMISDRPAFSFGIAAPEACLMAPEMDGRNACRELVFVFDSGLSATVTTDSP